MVIIIDSMDKAKFAWPRYGFPKKHLSINRSGSNDNMVMTMYLYMCVSLCKLTGSRKCQENKADWQEEAALATTSVMFSKTEADKKMDPELSQPR